MGLKSRFSVWYRRGAKWHCLQDNLSMKVAYSSVDTLRKAGMQSFVVIGA